MKLRVVLGTMTFGSQTNQPDATAQLAHFVDHTANEIAKAQQHSQELWCGQDSATRPTAMDKLATVRAALYINSLKPPPFGARETQRGRW